MTDDKDAEELTQGYFQKFGGFTCSWENVQQIISEMLESEKALKETLSRAGYRIAELKHEIDELKEKLKGLESGDVAWQGDMDATIKQNLELKEQNKAILEDNDELNKWIDELKQHNEKMKCCANCNHKNIYEYEFLNECRLTGKLYNLEHKCNKWELSE